MLELKQIKDLFDKDYIANQTTRERAANDLVFYWVTQWDDGLLSDSQLGYRGEFNILRKAGRNIMSDLMENPVQVDFVPIDDTRDDAAEIADGLYRKGLKQNTSIEAFGNGESENIVCGYGAWKLYTKYESKRPGNKNQIICRKPIYEANNTVFWDSNSKLLDKSDAKRCTVLTSYSEEGYKDLIENIKGERPEKIDVSNFKDPEQSYTFPWILGDTKKIYVGEFYHLEEIEDSIIIFEDPFGEEVEYRKSDIKEVEDDLIDGGYNIVDEQTIKRNIVTKYIVSGEDILKTERIVGEYIPIVPCYGEHAIIEGQEHWEGITRLAKDPSRLRNFAFSYLADILSRSPRNKPIFWRDQIAGYERMYEENGADNNYPYYLMHRYDSQGNELPIGPVGELPDQAPPTALPMILQLTKEATEDVANPGIPQDIADPDVSGKAILALQARIDKQSMVYQEHMKHAKRRDGQIWASMAKEVYDVPRKTMIEMPDGTRKQVEIMQSVIDQKTGDIVVLNDISNAEFEIYSEIGPSYASQKDQTIETLMEMIAIMDPADPVRKALQLKVLELKDGVDFEDIREYVRKQLILMGIKEPETPEEQQMLAQAQQNQEPDPAMLLAMAENKKGEADLLEQKRKGIEMQLNSLNDRLKTQIDAFEAQTDRMMAQINAERYNAEIENKKIDSFGKTIDNTMKIVDLKNLTNEQLLSRLMGENTAAAGK